MNFLALGCLFAGTSVALGAFGAHGLKSILSQESLQTFEVGVRYQMYHSLALIGIGILSKTFPNLNFQIEGIGMLVGILFFSGSLYGLAMGGPRILGPITPLGGSLWLISWGLLTWKCWQQT